MEQHTESMASAAETVLNPVSNDLLGLNDNVTWRARHFGMWWTMTSRITRMNAPAEFTDEQVSGPFRRFHHTHTFSQLGEHTLMTDTVEFQAPLGPLGRVAEKAVLERYLHNMLERRANALAQRE